MINFDTEALKQALSEINIEVVKPYRRPKFYLNPSLNLSEEFKVAMGQWCAEFFGWEYKEMLEDGEVLSFNGKLLMNQHTYETYTRTLKQFQSTYSN